jgi:outer membrane protein
MNNTSLTEIQSSIAHSFFSFAFSTKPSAYPFAMSSCHPVFSASASLASNSGCSVPNYGLLKPLVAALALGFAALAAAPAMAQADPAVSEANTLIRANNFKAAFDLLSPQEAAKAGNPDFDLALGVAANGAGQYTRAVFALERLLAVQPNNALGRAELGRALFALNDTSAAKKAFEDAKRLGAPEAAQRTLNDFLQAIERSEDEGKTSLRAHIEASVGHDSNINSSTGTRDIAVPAFGGLVVTLNPAGVKQSSSYGTLGGGATLRIPLANPRLAVVGNITGQVRHNFGHSNFDTAQVDSQLGLNYRANRNEFTVAGQAGGFRFDDKLLRKNYGGVGEWSHRLDGYRQFNVYGQLGRLAYPTASVRDANRYVLGGTYAHGFRNALVLVGGAYLGREKERAANVGHLGHRLWGIRTAVQMPINERWLGFASLNYENRHYGANDPLFLVTRRDKQTSFSAGVTFTPAKDWRVTPQVQIVRNNSNTAVTDYKRSIASVTLRKDF